MADILNMNNAFLDGESKFKGMLARIEQKYQGPMLDAALAKYFKEMDPTLKEELRQQSPQAFASMEAQFGKEG